MTCFARVEYDSSCKVNVIVKGKYRDAAGGSQSAPVGCILLWTPRYTVIKRPIVLIGALRHPTPLDSNLHIV